jgi:hypothetical protein
LNSAEIRLRILSSTIKTDINNEVNAFKIKDNNVANKSLMGVSVRHERKAVPLDYKLLYHKILTTIYFNETNMNFFKQKFYLIPELFFKGMR